MCFYFETGSHSVVQASLKLMIFLPQSNSAGITAQQCVTCLAENVLFITTPDLCVSAEGIVGRWDVSTYIVTGAFEEGQ
jgi:hypothetical protein